MDKPKVSKLTNGLTVITLNIPHLDSVTTLVAVGAGTRYEVDRNNGISHFLEHMFFKGSKKYQTAEIISTIVDGMGAINNAWTFYETTVYWIKSSAKHLDKATDILSSMVKESLLDAEEVNREKGVIIEEIRRMKDNPSSYIWKLYHKLHFGDHVLGRDVLGEDQVILGLTRDDFVDYVNEWYSPSNMAVVFVGNLPKNIQQLAKNYFSDLKGKKIKEFKEQSIPEQKKARVSVFYKDTDQANIILGVQGFKRTDPRRYVAKLISAILGEGMSSRLFLQIRERRGLAYSVGSEHESFKDNGVMVAYGGLKKDKLEEAVRVMKEEMEKLSWDVTEEELKKAKEMIRGRLSLRSESTNFLAEMFGVDLVLDGEVETIPEYLKKIDAVTLDQVKKTASEMFKPHKYNLAIIGPYKSADNFQTILES